MEPAEFSRRIYASRRLAFALLAIVTANLCLRLVAAADPVVRHSGAAWLASGALGLLVLAGSLALLANTRAWLRLSR